MELSVSVGYWNKISLAQANILVGAPLTSKGYERVAVILDCTLELLAEQGYAAVSISEVARRSGIAKGNVQYYFPTNAALMRGALKVQVARLKVRWEATLRKKHANGRERLGKLITTDIAVSRSDRHKALALEKWAYANRDSEAREIVHEWYLWVIQTYQEILEELRPDLSEKERLQLAALMNALLEGSTPFFGRARLQCAALSAMTKPLEQALWAMIRNFGGHEKGDSNPIAASGAAARCQGERLHLSRTEEGCAVVIHGLCHVDAQDEGRAIHGAWVSFGVSRLGRR